MHAEDTNIKNLTLKPTEIKDDVKITPEEKGATTFTYEEAFRSTLEYFKGDELAATVWVNKYALKDSFGKIYERDPDHMHWRIAREIARIEQKYPNP
jgi:ribonucleoside-diphosphate reductase alpha chain